MRPMAILALVLAGLLVAVVVVLVLEIRRRWTDAAREAARWAEVVEVQALVHREVEELLREELAQALDRVQAPQAAVAFSQSERAVRAAPVEGATTMEGEELSLGDLERATAQLLAEEAEKRGIDPSELSVETGPSSGGL